MTPLADLLGAAAETSDGPLLRELFGLLVPDAQSSRRRRARAALRLLLAHRLADGSATPPRPGAQELGALDVDALIAALARMISEQLDAILHHRTVRALETAWRSLAAVAASCDASENVLLDVLDVSKEELRQDFDDAAEIPQSSLYRIVYTREYGMFGGQPYSLICGLYEFGPGPTDVALLQNIGTVAAAAHAPFVAGADPSILGCTHWEQIAGVSELSPILESPTHVRWCALCAGETARYLFLTMPRILLRAPYGRHGRRTISLPYEERVEDPAAELVWGSGAVVVASAVAECHRRFRWSPNLLGIEIPFSEAARDWFGPYHGIHAKVPIEVILDESQDREAAVAGLIAVMTNRREGAFFLLSASSLHGLAAAAQPGSEDMLGRYLGAQLQYLLVVARLGHYLKLFQRDRLGAATTRAELEKELNEWLRRYVVDMENPAATVRAQRPLRQGKVTVEEVPGEAGWYRATLRIRPHFRYQGASFEVAIVGKLETPGAERSERSEKGAAR